MGQSCRNGNGLLFTVNLSKYAFKHQLSCFAHCLIVVTMKLSENKLNVECKPNQTNFS